MTMTTTLGAPVLKSIDDLLLDSANPRIPLEKASLPPDDLTAYVAETYNSLAIAESIAAHQFFPSEPLIAIPTKGKQFIVVEGNRRLAALKLLRDPLLREKLADRASWDAVDASKVPASVPVVVAKTRKEVAPIIGYRHISGIQPWDAYSKARYIAAQVDGGLGFEKTAREVGERPSEVRANYRNFRIAAQAEKIVSVAAANEMKDNFGVFTRAMQTGNLRSFIGAPAPDKVTTTKNPVPATKKDALKEFVGFLFGPNAVIEESRDLTKLGKVLASPDGLKVLRAEGNLQEAHIASGGLRDRLVGRLDTAGRNLRAAMDDMPSYRKDAKVGHLLDECIDALDALTKARKKA